MAAYRLENVTSTEPEFDPVPLDMTQILDDLVSVTFKEVGNMEVPSKYAVKYWPNGAPNNYTISEVTDRPPIDLRIKVIPGVEYTFEAVAGKDLGVLGIDWHRGEPVTFFTIPNAGLGQMIRGAGKTVGYVALKMIDIWFFSCKFTR